jgi:hypothetical protein
MLEQHLATDVFQDQHLHFQIVVLDRQLFIWIGTEPACLNNLCLATPTRMVRRYRCRRRRAPGLTAWMMH